MTKELQDRVWKHFLPKEFKEEVKYEYRRVATKATKDSYDLGFMHAHEGMFGHHNLTSDAEGEEEILCVSRKQLLDAFNSAKIIGNSKMSSKMLAGAADMCVNTFKELFGSKCLPDEAKDEAKDETKDEAKDGAKEPKPAEPKFMPGDIAVVHGFEHPLLKQDGAIVTILSYHDKGDFYSCAIAPNVGIDVGARYLSPYKAQKEPKYHVGEKVRYNGYVYEVIGLSGRNRYILKGLNFDLDEDMIEPYPEPLSQNPTENCDNESHISADCDKPAEPKFKVGDYARYKGDVHKVVATTKDNRCYLNKILGSIDESDLEPYTEPTDFGKEVNFPTKKQSRNFSQETANCDKQLDILLTDSSLKERRLNIAAQFMSAMMSNPSVFHHGLNAEDEDFILYGSLEFADALIAEVEKGAE